MSTCNPSLASTSDECGVTETRAHKQWMLFGGHEMLIALFNYLWGVQ